MRNPRSLPRLWNIEATAFALVLLMSLSAQASAAIYALAGDSTIAPNNGNDGWGDALVRFLPPGSSVLNHGANGRSTKTFLKEGRWQAVLDLKADYVLIQFGHNDQKIDKPNRGTHAVDNPTRSGDALPAAPLIATSRYRDNLRLMIDTARANGAQPILLTPVARRSAPHDSAQAQIDWNRTPQASDSFGNSYSLRDYADATLAVGREKNAPVIDLNQLSLDLYAQMIASGEDLSTLGPAGDNTHFNLNGMPPIAKLVAAALPAAITPQPDTDHAVASPTPRVPITDFGAVADGATVNTAAIQQAIEQLATHGGGTVVVPRGVFVSGALFFRPGVNLHLDADAVLRCSTDMQHFPEQRTRIEGHFEESFNPALINADGCDRFRLSGGGVLDGAGKPIWDRFWKLRREAPDYKNFANISVPRARLALIENSQDVVIEGVTFKDSQFWNLHLYRCSDVLVQGVRFVVPDEYPRAPSTDGIDIDSSQDVSVRGCFFSVTDDCIAAKGSKGPFAQQDKDSPPVERVHVSNCVFQRGGALICLGSEAATVRDIVVENCQVTGSMPLLKCKLRPDTPQVYENLTIRNVDVDNQDGTVLKVSPWTQYFDLNGQEPPKSVVRDIDISGVKGRTKSLALVAPNKGQTTIAGVTLRNIDLQLSDAQPIIRGVEHLTLENVTLNGTRFDLESR